ncbi:hypothetical protein [Salinibacter ruber]|jgi:hypothetical protein|uniref:Uncharacterized protein n=1 Tax=Salinibacter ruber TaxID=146919 RepID=A0A9X2ZAA3_9BACT|nr:hypothetical protein [Salinibacter ruber]MBB4090434.1 hypothetical protein [Salinibacter ruber]MCS3611666.1 hypothetical protein [Salinibacter ruber]MCS3613763.1 hypothetical protein [Salinibacter ruber]MCS3639357.1 hypothetical protein [Salinibacter ruber]MCS3645880.1 hypothetical protein [Salinibacter ruber]
MDTTSEDTPPNVSFRTRLAVLRPRDHATLLLTPILVGLGLLEGATSGGAPADLFSAGLLLALAAVGGYRSYMAWRKPSSDFQAERPEGNPAS